VRDAVGEKKFGQLNTRGPGGENKKVKAKPGIADAIQKRGGNGSAGFLPDGRLDKPTHGGKISNKGRRKPFISKKRGPKRKRRVKIKKSLKGPLWKGCPNAEGTGTCIEKLVKAGRGNGESPQTCGKSSVAPVKQGGSHRDV